MKQFARNLLFLFILFITPLTTFASSQPLETNFLVISDIHLDQSYWLPMTINPYMPNPLNDLDQISFETMLLTIYNNIKKRFI